MEFEEYKYEESQIMDQENEEQSIIIDQNNEGQSNNFSIQNVQQGVFEQDVSQSESYPDDQNEIIIQQQDQQNRVLNSNSSTINSSQIQDSISTRSQSQTNCNSSPKHIYQRYFRFIKSSIKKEYENIESVDELLTKIDQIKDQKWKEHLMWLFKEIKQQKSIYLRCFEELCEKKDQDIQQFENDLYNHLIYLTKRKKKNDEHIQYVKDKEYYRVIQEIQKMIQML
ncbi:hypothetical protein ABPG74_005266 [Tetrahymena malaccensis]